MNNIYLFFLSTILFLAITPLRASNFKEEYGRMQARRAIEDNTPPVVDQNDNMELSYSRIWNKTKNRDYKNAIKHHLEMYQYDKRNGRGNTLQTRIHLAILAILNPKHAINGRLIYDCNYGAWGCNTFNGLHIQNYRKTYETGCLQFMAETPFLNGTFCNGYTNIQYRSTLSNYYEPDFPADNEKLDNFSFEQLMQEYTLYFRPFSSIKKNLKIFINLLKTDQDLKKKIVAFEIDLNKDPCLFTIYPVAGKQNAQDVVNLLYQTFDKGNNDDRWWPGHPKHTERLSCLISYSQGNEEDRENYPEYFDRNKICYRPSIFSLKTFSLTSPDAKQRKKIESSAHWFISEKILSLNHYFCMKLWQRPVLALPVFCLYFYIYLKCNFNYTITIGSHTPQIIIK